MVDPCFRLRPELGKLDTKGLHRVIQLIPTSIEGTMGEMTLMQGPEHVPMNSRGKFRMARRVLV